MPSSAFEFTVKTAVGESASLNLYKGKVALIVNVASKCGFTPQYTGLEKLYQKLKDKNFVVLGFPCNQFGGQEPGTDKQVQDFCQLEYGVTFPVFAKIEVNGENADPLYVHLKSAAPGLLGTEAIKWNFTKFLIDQNGKVIERYAPQIKPEDIETDILKAMAKI